MPDRSRTYTVIFPRSRSRNYPDVLRAARTLPGFTEGDPSVISICPGDISNHIRAFTFVLNSVRRWKGAQVYIDDVPLDAWEWAGLLRVIYCHLGRERDPLPEFYCRPFGCRFLFQLRLPPDGPWRRKYAVVMREVRAKQIDLCPAFDRETVAEYLGADNPKPPEPESHEGPALTNEDIWKAIEG